MPGEYEPNDSRNVTGMSDQGMGTPGGADQMETSDATSQIREHMEVIGADGVHVGTVDAVEGHRIKLTRSDSGMGSHADHHHYLSIGLVAEVEGDRVRLSANGNIAYEMLQED